MTDCKVGDLVQFQTTLEYPLYLKLLNGRIGIVKNIRKQESIAYIKWSNLDDIDTWVPYIDLKLLNRE